MCLYIRMNENQEGVNVSMRNVEERITLMHRRAAELQKEKHDRVMMSIFGSMSMCLFSCLLSLTMVFSRAGHAIVPETATAASLLSENVGGYVLVAVVSFMLGVFFVATIKYVREQKKKK